MVSPEFARIFQTRAGSTGTMSFAQFMALALYEPEVGYYTRPTARIGYGAGTDFFTASTSGPVFGELIAAACVQLLGRQNPRDFEFVELGAETEGGILAGVDHPFHSARSIGLGETVRLLGNCVCFSNELFDAQPFNRFVFRAGVWRELGVALDAGVLVECEVAEPTHSWLPANAPENYVIDAPLVANDLLNLITDQPWSGLFVACDYGKSWSELATATPAGTARAYFRHTQSNDLLAQPGEQDITCHVCWDWLAARLSTRRFTDVVVESQESFLMHRAGTHIASIVAAEASRLSPKKLSLMQLLHPAHLGQRFQVLHARRNLVS